MSFQGPSPLSIYLKGVYRFITELRRPKGPPSRAPYTYRKAKETHELIFSWLSCLAVLLVGMYTRWEQQSRARWQPCSSQQLKRDLQPWFMVSFFDAGHPCYGQLTPVKTKNILTSFTWSHLLKFRAHWVHMCFFEVGRWPRAGFWLDLWLVSNWLDVKRAGLSGSGLTLTQD